MFAATQWGNTLLIMIHSNEYIKMLCENPLKKPDEIEKRYEERYGIY